MYKHNTSTILTVAVSTLTLQWLKALRSGRYDSADPENDNFESCIWDIENINVNVEEWTKFLTVLYANTTITKEDIGEARYLDIYVDEAL